MEKEYTLEESMKIMESKVRCPQCGGETRMKSRSFPWLHVTCCACRGRGWVKDEPSPCDVCDPVKMPMCNRCIGS